MEYKTYFPTVFSSEGKEKNDDHEEKRFRKSDDEAGSNDDFVETDRETGKEYHGQERPVK